MHKPSCCLCHRFLPTPGRVGVRAVAVLSGLPPSLLVGNDVLAVNTEGLNQPPQVAPDRQKDVSKTADRTADGEGGVTFPG